MARKGGGGLAFSRNESLGLIRGGLIVVTLAAIAWSLNVRSACAQKGGLAGKRNEITKMLRDKEITDSVLFDGFFKEYFLKQFVKPTTPYSLDDLHKVRAHLKIYLVTGKTGAAHDRLNELVLEQLTKVVLSRESFGEYDSAIRYNAMLTLGELNDEDTPEGKPWSRPLDSVLLRAVTSKSLRDYLKVGALIGIERYATAKAIAPAKATEVSKVMFDLVKQSDPPADRDPAVHAWIRRAAAQVLVSLGTLGPDNNVIQALTGILMSPQARPTVRCEVAQLLGQLKYPVNAKVDYQSLANYVGHETLELCKREIDSAKADNRPASRRMLAYVLSSASLGLEGNDGKGGLWAAAAAAPDSQKFIDTLRAKVKSLAASLDDSDSDPDPLPATALAELQSTLVPLPADKEKEAKQATDEAKPAAAQAAAGAAKVGR
jgi:hypothetical protein